MTEQPLFHSNMALITGFNHSTRWQTRVLPDAPASSSHCGSVKYAAVYRRVKRRETAREARQRKIWPRMWQRAGGLGNSFPGRVDRKQCDPASPSLAGPQSEYLTEPRSVGRLTQRRYVVRMWEAVCWDESLMLIMEEVGWSLAAGRDSCIISHSGERAQQVNTQIANKNRVNFFCTNTTGTSSAAHI